MKNIIFTLCFAILLITHLVTQEAQAYDNFLLKVDTPLKALALYFPSPPVMRCLSHSDIPKNLRKALIYRKITFPDKDVLEHNILIGIDSKSRNKFIFTSSFVDKGEIIRIETNGGPFFNRDTNNTTKTKSLFGLEDILDVGKKVTVNEMIGNQKISFEVFLRKAKGKIGTSNYNLELFGSDRKTGKDVKYFLNGEGKLGDKNILVRGQEINKDYYEINEVLGELEVFTWIRVYD